MKYFLFLFSFLTAAVLCADTVPFRGGSVLAAELSLKKPEFDNFSEAKMLKTYLQPAYAAVVVKLQPERKISVCDYKLETMGVSFDCIAIRTNDGKFDMDTAVQNADSYTLYTLLFLVEAHWIRPNAANELNLRSVAGPENRSSTALIFNHKNSQDFTRPGQIPANGIMKKLKK